MTSGPGCAFRCHAPVDDRRGSRDQPRGPVDDHDRFSNAFQSCLPWASDDGCGLPGVKPTATVVVARPRCRPHAPGNDLYLGRAIAGDHAGDDGIWIRQRAAFYRAIKGRRGGGIARRRDDGVADRARQPQRLGRGRNRCSTSPGRGRGRSRWSCSIWIGSSRSMISSATPPATGSCARSPIL